MRKILFITASLLLIPMSYFTVFPSEQSVRFGSFISSIFVVLFALPSYYYLTKWLGRNPALKIILTLSLYALLVETIALKTGYPYGEFIYTDKIGFKLFGITPWTVPFAWIPLLLGVYTLSSLYSRPIIRRIINTVLLLTIVDAVIDPAAVELRFWQYSLPNLRTNYYEVPLSNFGGWLITGLAGTLIFYNLIPEKKRTEQPPTNILISLYLILFFWTCVCFWLQLAFAFWIGVLFTGLCFFHLLKKQNAV